MKVKKLFFKLLANIGLTTIERQNLAEQRANNADEYARLVTARAGESGDMIISGDYTVVRDIVFGAGRRLIVAPWVINTHLAGLYFEGENK